MLEDLIAGWDGEHTVIRFDRPTGTWMFVCVHSTVRGPAGGGTRMAVYQDPADGLADAMRLSAAMTKKMAILQMLYGGGKAVLAVPELFTGEARRGLLLRYGDLVASLGGTFRTAADMNTSAADMDVIAERCRYVYGRSQGRGGAGDSGWGPRAGSSTASVRALATCSARTMSSAAECWCRARAAWAASWRGRLLGPALRCW